MQTYEHLETERLALLDKIQTELPPPPDPYAYCPIVRTKGEISMNRNQPRTTAPMIGAGAENYSRGPRMGRDE